MSLEECCCLEPEAGERFSVSQMSRQEADQFKWIESQKAGCDLGETALKRWIAEHWWGFLRARWIEHLQGSRCWIELDEKDYGLLNREFHDQKPLLDKIVSRLIQGMDNLEIIRWALDSQLPLEPIFNILERLDINGHRLILEYNNAAAEETDSRWYVRC